MSTLLSDVSANRLFQCISHIPRCINSQLEEKSPATMVLMTTASLLAIAVLKNSCKKKWGQSNREKAGQPALRISCVKQKYSKDTEKQLDHFQESVKKKQEKFKPLHTKIPEKGIETKDPLEMVEQSSKTTSHSLQDKHLSGTMYSNSLDGEHKDPELDTHAAVVKDEFAEDTNYLASVHGFEVTLSAASLPITVPLPHEWIPSSNVSTITLPEPAQRVQNVLDAHKLAVLVKQFNQSTHTSQEAARTVGCEVGRIAKTIIFKLKEQPVCVVASGVNKISDKKIRQLAGGNGQIRRADGDFVRKYTSFEIGGVCPFGHNLKPYIDADLMSFDTIWIAAGTSDTLVEMTPDALLRITEGIVADVKT